MNSNILIIVNPISGRKKSKNYYNIIKSNLENQGFTVDIKFTTVSQNAKYIVENLQKEYKYIIACGGDGTLNEITHGLYNLNKKITIGFIPCGTTNDYARNLNIPRNKKHLSKNISDYTIIQVDLGTFNEKTFNYCVTFGLFAKTSYSVSRKAKNLFGRFAYIFSGIKEVFNYKTYQLKVKYDENEIEDEFIFGSITNSRYLGGFHIFRKEQIKIDDGMFEVLLIKKPRNFFDTVAMLFKIMLGNLKGDNIYYFKTDKLHIESLSESPEWSVDGENGGNRKDVYISNVNNASEYLVLPKDNK